MPDKLKGVKSGVRLPEPEDVGQKLYEKSVFERAPTDTEEFTKGFRYGAHLPYPHSVSIGEKIEMKARGLLNIPKYSKAEDDEKMAQYGRTRAEVSSELADRGFGRGEFEQARTRARLKGGK